MEDPPPKQRSSYVSYAFHNRGGTTKMTSREVYWVGDNEDSGKGTFMTQTCQGNCGHPGRRQPPTLTVTSLCYAGTMEGLQWTPHHHRPVRQGVGAETTFNSGGVY